MVKCEKCGTDYKVACHVCYPDPPNKELLPTDIDGLLLCSKCENPLRVEYYSKESGFFKIYPCVWCINARSL